MAIWVSFPSWENTITSPGTRLAQAVDALVEQSYSIKFGARNLRRLIEKEVVDQAATLIIGSFDAPITQLFGTATDGKILVTGK